MENRPIFEAGGVVYGWRHVLDLARFLGELDPIMAGVRTSLACLELARHRKMTLGKDALKDALDSLRYDRDLITAQETEVWLTQNDITLADLNSYLERRNWKERLAGDDAVPDEEAAVEDGLIEKALWIEYVVDRNFNQLSASLAVRVAVSLEKADEPLESGAVAEEMRRFRERVGCPSAGVADWLRRTGMTTERLNELARMEARYRAGRREALTDANLSRQLQVRFLPLTRYDVQWAYFGSEDVAREVYMCVTEDGEDLPEVLSRAGTDSEFQSVYFEELIEDLKPVFMAAKPGKISRPVPLDDEFGVFLVHDKAEPSIDDENVRRLLEGGVLSAAFGNLMVSHVRWQTGHQ